MEIKSVARIVKEAEVRRSEILDTAQKLFYLNGYEQTSVQTIIADIGIAKGTFYHYFSSKLDLLDAIIEGMLEQILQSLEPMVEDEQLLALEKFERFFNHIANWKTENRAFFLSILNIWYKDENAIFRQKVSTASVTRTVPSLTKIIEQGIAEGVFATEYPAEVAEIVLQIGQSLSDALAKIVLNSVQNDDSRATIKRKTTAYQYAIERVLNAPPGSVKIFDVDLMYRWLD
jgi:AcrR family transcriptional regulator